MIPGAASSGSNCIAGLAIGLQPVGSHLADVEVGRLFGAAATPATLRLSGRATRAPLVRGLRVAGLRAQRKDRMMDFSSIALLLSPLKGLWAI